MKTPNVLIPVALAMSVCASLAVQAQDSSSKQALPAAASSPAAITSATTPLELARAAYMAQGGEKFKNLKSMVLIGSVNLSPPNSTNSIPGQFVIVTAGARVRIEVSAPPVISFKQIYDGQNSYSS